MNNLTLSLQFTGTSKTIPPGTAGVYTARKFGDPRMVDLMGLTTAKEGGNFQHVDLYSPPNTSFGAVTNYQPMDAAALDYLTAIQPTTDPAKLQRIMNWLGIGVERGRPYMYKNGVDCWGTMVFGGQKVLVETDIAGLPIPYRYKVKYSAQPSAEMITFYKLIGLRRSQLDDPTITHATHPWLIQQCTAAEIRGSVQDVYNETPRGDVMYNPVWSPLDWSTNTGSRALYIAQAFLEEF